MKCTLCPRECNVDRKRNKGFCNTDGIVVSRIGVHEWEEPCISGDKGSGTVFFAGCNLHCRFCQNYDISVVPRGAEVSVERLADIMLYLQFCSPKVSGDLANATDYFNVAVRAIAEMRRQQPIDEFDSDGYIKRGVIVRHLVLPSYVEDSKRVLDWLSAFDSDIRVSLMSQYFTARRDDEFPQLNRKLYRREYQAVTEYFFNVGLHNGYGQEFSSATRDYLPDFDVDAVEKLLNVINRVYTK